MLQHTVSPMNLRRKLVRFQFQMKRFTKTQDISECHILNDSIIKDYIEMFVEHMREIRRAAHLVAVDDPLVVVVVPEAVEVRAEVPDNRLVFLFNTFK